MNFTKEVVSMKKMIALLLCILSGALIVFILYNNRQKVQEMAATEKLNAYPVSTVAVKKQKITDSMSQTGEIVAVHDVVVIAETQGKVNAVMADAGSYVSAGAAIVKVDDELPKAKFLAVRANYEKTKKDYQRFEILFKEDIISDSQFETARLAYKASEAEYTAARREYKNAVITAPISGLITMRPVNVGDIVAPGTVVANIVDISQLKIRVNVAEQDAFKLKAGDPAVITTDVYPAVKFNGRIKSISAKGDESHTFTVETMIGFQEEHPLKAGMFGRVSFNQESKAEVLTVPREAIIGSIKNPQVYVVQNGIAKLHNIIIEDDNSPNLVVLQGLNPGDRVVVNGQDNLEDNAQVTIE
jgi:RND family efflux transporter MFP subunit